MPVIISRCVDFGKRLGITSIWPPGYGSNLTLDGTVECDAAIMDGQTGDFGSVGAVSGNCTDCPVTRSSPECIAGLSKI